MSCRYVYWAAAILLLSAAYACYCQAPLIWDGAYQFDMTLALQRPYVYLTRFHTFFLWYPTVWASRVTDNVNVLQAVYGLPFLLAPVTGLLLSWWMVRREAPGLILWVVFGILTTVGGQIFVINDSFFQLHLFWPLFVAMFVRLTWPQKFILGILAVFQFAHPLGVLLMGGTAVAAALVAIVDRENRLRLLGRAGAMFFLCLLAAAKIVIANHLPQWTDAYAQDEATWANAVARWRAAVSGTPLRGMVWLWAAGAATFVQPLLARRRGWARAAGVIACLCLARSASYWLFWAHGPVCLWGGAIDYRRWVGPLAAPFFIFATAEVILAAVRHRAAGRDQRCAEEFVGSANTAPTPDAGSNVAESGSSASLRTGVGGSLPNDEATFRSDCAFSDTRASDAPSIRGPLAVLCALLFAVTLGMQYTTWHQRAMQLMQAVAGYGAVIVPNADPALAFVDHSPLAHWATGNYVSAMLGKQPAKLFLDEQTEKQIRGKYFDPTIPEADRSKMGWSYYAAQPDAPPGPGGWFDFRPALAQAGRESAMPSRREPGKILNGIP